MSTEQQLASKIAELERLQKEFDEFIESSKEIEVELENSVKSEMAKSAELQKKLIAAEEKIESSSSKSSQLSSQYIKISSEVSKLKELCNNLESAKIKLEIQNNELLEKNRILETSVEDLQHKLSNTEEEVYFLQNDLVELENVKTESESRLKSELTQLQAELARLDISSDLITSTEATNDRKVNSTEEQKEYIESLEEEIKNLSIKLTESEQQNQELNDEMSKLTDELMTISEEKALLTQSNNINTNNTITVSNEEIEDLRNQLQDALEHISKLEQNRLEYKDRLEKAQRQFEFDQQQLDMVQQHLQQQEIDMVALNEELLKSQDELVIKSNLIDELKVQLVSKDDMINRTMEELTKKLDMKSQIIDGLEKHLKEALDKYIQLDMKYKEVLLSQSESKIISEESKSQTMIPIPKNEEYLKLLKENESLQLQLSQLNSKLNAMELDYAGDKDEVIVPMTENPMATPKSSKQNTPVIKSSSPMPVVAGLPSSSSSTTSSPMVITKKEPSSIQMETIYKSSPEPSPGTIRRDNKSSSSIRRGSSVSTNNRAMKRGSSLVIETSPMASAQAAEYAIIDEAIDKMNIELLLLESTTTARAATRSALISNDLETIRNELMKQTKQYEDLKSKNAKLLQQILITKSGIQVCCRTRPPIDQEIKDGKICVDVIDDYEIASYDKRADTWKSFAFDKVWHPLSTQADVFADIEPLALSVTEGYNVCIMAYGQTGSGKTYTMNGYGKEFGVSYRTVHKIFELLEQKKVKLTEQYNQQQQQLLQAQLTVNGHVDNITENGSNRQSSATPPTTLSTLSAVSYMDTIPFTYTVEVSMLEIYNEQVNDLLDNSTLGTNLDIRQNADGGTHVPGLRQVAVTCLVDVMQVFAQGSANRATGSTNLNEHSSRSHLILSVIVTTTTGDEASVKGKLNLVDLAGSEKVSKSGVTGTAMKEAQHINKSLSALGDVLEALDQKSKHIPYRNSKLTYLLQDSLSGSSKTMMIVTVCPTEYHADETLFTLQFASRVRNITFVNPLGSTKRHVNSKNLEEGVKVLKSELKESKRQRQLLEESQNELKKEIKRMQDKFSSLAEGKTKSVDEIRRVSESNVSALTKQNQDMAAKLSEEKEQKWKLLAEVEALQKCVRKLQDRNALLESKISSTSTSNSVSGTPRHNSANNANNNGVGTTSNLSITLALSGSGNNTNLLVSGGIGTPVGTSSSSSSSSGIGNLTPNNRTLKTQSLPRKLSANSLLQAMEIPSTPPSSNSDLNVVSNSSNPITTTTTTTTSSSSSTTTATVSHSIGKYVPMTAAAVRNKVASATNSRITSRAESPLMSDGAVPLPIMSSPPKPTRNYLDQTTAITNTSESISGDIYSSLDSGGIVHAGDGNSNINSDINSNTMIFREPTPNIDDLLQDSYPSSSKSDVINYSNSKIDYDNEDFPGLRAEDLAFEPIAPPEIVETIQRVSSIIPAKIRPNPTVAKPKDTIESVNNLKPLHSAGSVTISPQSKLYMISEGFFKKDENIGNKSDTITGNKVLSPQKAKIQVTTTVVPIPSSPERKSESSTTNTKAPETNSSNLRSNSNPISKLPQRSTTNSSLRSGSNSRTTKPTIITTTTNTSEITSAVNPNSNLESSQQQQQQQPSSSLLLKPTPDLKVTSRTTSRSNSRGRNNTRVSTGSSSTAIGSGTTTTNSYVSSVAASAASRRATIVTNGSSSTTATSSSNSTSTTLVTRSGPISSINSEAIQISPTIANSNPEKIDEISCNNPTTPSGSNNRNSFSEDKTTTKPNGLAIASRSKEALLKHQERMDRFREQRAAEAKALADKLRFTKQNNGSSTTPSSSSAANNSNTSFSSSNTPTDNS